MKKKIIGDKMENVESGLKYLKCCRICCYNNAAICALSNFLHECSINIKALFKT